MRDEVALISGGSSGIGLATARDLAARGASVWLAARDAEGLRKAAANIPGRVHTFPADVTDSSSVSSLLSEIRSREGRLDILVHSAGQLVLAPAASEITETARRIMDVNYLGLTRLVNASLPLLRLGSRRSIVSLSSFAGKLVPPFFGPYSATKFAVQAYSHALRQELRAEGFHVGVVLPGPVRSPMTDDVLGTEMYPVPFGVPVIGPDQVSSAIVRCILRRRAEVVVPAHFGPLLRLASAFPRLVDFFYRPYFKTKSASETDPDR